MRELEIEQRLIRIEENIVALRKLLENSLERTVPHHRPPDRSLEHDIMSVKQLAHFLGLDATVIYSKCSKGEIPYFKLGKQYRFKRVEIERWLNDQKGSDKISVDDYVDRYLHRHVLKS